MLPGQKGTVKFRSVFPHEPLPSTEEENEGYVHIQGGFTPKTITSTAVSPNASDDGVTVPLPDVATTESILRSILRGEILPEHSPFRNLPHKNLISITVETTDTKKNSNNDTHQPKKDRPLSINRARLTYPSPAIARDIVSFLRTHKITPASMFVSSSVPEPYGNTHSYSYSSKAIQATQVTQLPILPPDKAWNRVGPPKFRRLLFNSQQLDPSKTLGDEVEATRQTLEHLRNETRFVFVSNILSLQDEEEIDQDDIDIVAFQDSLREALRPYLTVGSIPPELFLPSKKQHSRFKYCHVGTRSPIDAKSLISNLQGAQLTLTLGPDKIIKTEKLFVDYADVTQRCATKASRIANNGSTTSSTSKDMRKKLEPPRPQCTSTTDSVVVPGLILVPEFVSVAEEAAMLAVLSGPNAPWAPAQRNLSQSGNVKRRVQHYGYVFSYETADVVRDRELESGCCPPMPAISKDANNENIDDFIMTAMAEGKGWDVLAGVIERVRNCDFSSNNSSEPIIEQLDFETQSENQIDEGISTNAALGIEPDLCKTRKPFTYPYINQLTVNEYKRGEGIGSHTDTISAFDDGLISISLNGDCVMEFKEPRLGMKKLVHLPPRSLLLMSGAARYKWEHLIVSRMTDHVNGMLIPRKTRISLTLRTAISLPDQFGNEAAQPLNLIESSQFPPVWGGDARAETEDLSTPDTEKNHVHAVYDAIAKQWHHTRGKRGVLWPGATQFLKCLPRGSVVADVGCGDGKYFPAIWEAGSYVIGFDISLPLLQTSVGACISQGDGPSNRRVSVKNESMDSRPAVGVADCMHVPLKSHSCDAAICIAVMHHLSSRPRRIRCLSELARVVKVGGCINVQAWALKQEGDSRRKFAGTDVFVPFNAQPRYLEQNSQDTTQNRQTTKGKAVAEMYADEYDGLAEYDERKGLVVFQRYCHMYREGELEELVSYVDSLELIESGFESGNYFIIAKVVETKT